MNQGNETDSAEPPKPIKTSGVEETKKAEKFSGIVLKIYESWQALHSVEPQNVLLHLASVSGVTNEALNQHFWTGISFGKELLLAYPRHSFEVVFELYHGELQREIVAPRYKGLLAKIEEKQQLLKNENTEHSVLNEFSINKPTNEIPYSHISFESSFLRAPKERNTKGYFMNADFSLQNALTAYIQKLDLCLKRYDLMKKKKDQVQQKLRK